MVYCNTYKYGNVKVHLSKWSVFGTKMQVAQRPKGEAGVRQVKGLLVVVTSDAFPRQLNVREWVMICELCLFV